MAKLISGTRIYGTANVDSTLFVGGTVFANNIVTTAIPSVLNDITNQFDNSKCVFQLRVDQSNVTSIMDSKNLEVVVDGNRLSPYVREIRYPWFTPYDSFKGYRVVSTNTSSQLVIYNAPEQGQQAILTLINSS